MPANDYIAMAYRQAATHLARRPVDVRWLDHMPGKLGVTFMGTDGTPTIYLKTGMKPTEELLVFCHEVAHVALGHADKMTPMKRADMKAYCAAWQEPATVADHARKAYAETYQEPAADALAGQWVKYADYHAAGPGILPRLLELLIL